MQLVSEGKKVPPLLAHRVTNSQNIDSGTLLYAESDTGLPRISHSGVSALMPCTIF